MRLVVDGVEVEVDDRHIKHPAMWVLQYVFGPGTSAATRQDDAEKEAAAAARQGAA